MNLPKFLLADASQLEEEIFVLHTEYPRFILNLATDEITWFEDISDEKEEELTQVMNDLVEEAIAFYEAEIEAFEKELD